MAETLTDTRPYIFAIKEGCPFMLTLPCNNSCAKHNTDVWELIRNQSSINTVVITMFYSRYYWNIPFDNGEGGVDMLGGKMYLECPENVQNSTKSSEILENYVNTITVLLSLKKNVILIYPVPETGWQTIAKIEERRFRGDRSILTTNYDAFVKRVMDICQKFDSIDNPLLKRIKPAEALCNVSQQGRCVTQSPTSIFYTDSHHFSMEATKLFAHEIKTALNIF
jgi:hypothetical protein